MEFFKPHSDVVYSLKATYKSADLDVSIAQRKQESLLAIKFKNAT